MNLDLVDAAEAVPVEELDEVPDGARTGHFPQALYRTRVLQLGVGGVGGCSRGFLLYSGAVQRATPRQNPRARVLVQRFPAGLKKNVPESHSWGKKQNGVQLCVCVGGGLLTTGESSSRGTQELSSTQEHKHTRGSSPEWACRKKSQGSLQSMSIFLLLLYKSLQGSYVGHLPTLSSS